MIKDEDPQATAIWQEYNRSIMTYYPQFSDQEIDNILAYTNYTPLPPITTNSDQSVQQNSSSISLDLILVVTTIVFLILATMLFLVQRTLLKIASTSGVDIESK
jgi:hypothetical protein